MRQAPYLALLIVVLTKGCTDAFQGLEPRELGEDASVNAGNAGEAAASDARSGGGKSAGDASGGSSGASDAASGGTSGEAGSAADASGKGGREAGGDGDAGGDADGGKNRPFATTQPQKITAPAEDAVDAFGRSVAISGDWALVGAYDTTLTGVAYVLHRDAARHWTITQKLTTPIFPIAQQWFGASVAIDGDAAIVGAPGSASRLGEVHFFMRSPGDVWTPTQLPSTSPSQSYGEGFGVVAIDGAKAAVGAPGATNGQGAAFTYVYDNGSWLGPNQAVAPDVTWQFGSSLVLDDGTLAVCARGAAYVFDWTGDAWVYKQKLVRESMGIYFCGSLALRGDTLVISRLGGGALHASKRSAGVWGAPELIATPPQLLDGPEGFGNGVAFCSDFAMVTGFSDKVTRSNVAFLDSEDWRPFGFSWDVIPDLYQASAACSGSSIAIGDSLVGNDYEGAVYVFDLVQ